MYIYAYFSYVLFKIPANTWFEVDIPNVKLCPTRNLYCKVKVSTAYTNSIKNPYTLDLETISVSFITGPTAFNQGSNLNIGAKSVVYLNSTEICRM